MTTQDRAHEPAGRGRTGVIVSTQYSTVRKITWQMTPGDVKEALRRYVEGHVLSHGKRVHELEAEVEEDGSANVTWTVETPGPGHEGAEPPVVSQFDSGG